MALFTTGLHRPLTHMEIDFTSPVWAAVVAFARKELERARMQLESTESTAEKTAALRGEIRFARKLLGLPEEAARVRSVRSAPAHPDDVQGFGPY